MVFDSLNMKELAQFSFIQNQDQYFFSAYYHTHTNMLYICYDRGFIKLFKLDAKALRNGETEQDKNKGLLWMADHQVDQRNSIIKFFKLSDEYLLGLAEKGILFVYNLTKSEVNRPYIM